MNPLEVRKQLLIAESELNRARLTEEIEVLAKGVSQFRKQAGTIGSIATTSVKLLVGLSELRHGDQEESKEKHSWVQTVIKSVGLVSSLWRTFRARDRDGD